MPNKATNKQQYDVVNDRKITDFDRASTESEIKWPNVLRV